MSEGGEDGEIDGRREEGREGGIRVREEGAMG